MAIEFLTFLARLFVNMMLRNIFGGWLFLWGGFAETCSLRDQSERGFVYFFLDEELDEELSQ